MKAFVQEPGGVDLYDGVDVKFILGQNPELVLYDEHATETRRIDLTAYDSTDALHALMRTVGFRHKERVSLDRHASCRMWARRGECIRNAAFMRATCATSCDEVVVQDEDEHCSEWAKMGHCESNPQYMIYRCSHSCATRRDEL